MIPSHTSIGRAASHEDYLGLSCLGGKGSTVTTAGGKESSSRLLAGGGGGGANGSLDGEHGLDTIILWFWVAISTIPMTGR
jgi:hypothetical protein